MIRLFVLYLFLAPLMLHASYIFKNGKLINSNVVATLSVQEHYSAVIEAYQRKDWVEMIHQSLIVTHNFPATPFADEVYFYLGVGYFYLDDFELSNGNLTKYLKKQATPKFFEEAIRLKFEIAERFHYGARKHMLGWESLPKWLPAQEEALVIYDEVITALPHHELAAKALFGKAQLLLKDEEYKSSVDTYQTLIRRFPKDPLAIESYIGIAEVYLMQSKEKYPDQDYLDLAEINLKKFTLSFPGEERIALAQNMFGEMQEVFAGNLYETGRFYERTKKQHAAYIYYTRILAKYPDTKVARIATKRLNNMHYTPEQAEQNQQMLKQRPAQSAEPSSPLLKLPVAGQIVDNHSAPSDREATPSAEMR